MLRWIWRRNQATPQTPRGAVLPRSCSILRNDRLSPSTCSAVLPWVSVARARIGTWVPTSMIQMLSIWWGVFASKQYELDQRMSAIGYYECTRNKRLWAWVETIWLRCLWGYFTKRSVWGVAGGAHVLIRPFGMQTHWKHWGEWSWLQAIFSQKAAREDGAETLGPWGRCAILLEQVHFGS